MRRKISLYIDGALADLKDQGLVLFNYSLTDLQKPTAVKNSYSKKLTLPGTPANDRIFSFAGRLDRETVPGSFNAGTRTPFQIMDDTGTIIESGYLRLDSVKRRGQVVDSYEVSLFGGLGSFFYMLSQNEDGTKMTLADLDYMGLPTEDVEHEFDFTIGGSSVLNAWMRLPLLANLNFQTLYDYITFVPAYEGIPEGDFDADKIYTQADYLPAQTGYSRDNYGRTIVKLPEKITGFEAHDFRSYMQRPAIAVAAMLRGIANTAEALGYEFDYSDIPTSLYARLWKTLPLLTSITSVKSETGSATATFSTPSSALPTDMATWQIQGLPSPVYNTINSTVRVTIHFDDGGRESTLKMYNNTDTTASFLVCQLVGYAYRNKVVGSDIVIIGPDRFILTNEEMQSLLSTAGYVPPRPAAGYRYVGTALTFVGDAHDTQELTFNLDAESYDNIVLNVTGISAAGTFPASGAHVIASAYYGTGCRPFYLWDGNGDECAINITRMEVIRGDETITYKTGTVPRSGATITKRMLLSTSKTPAEYLISLAKQFGWYFVADTDRKRVRLLTRNSFFSTGEDVIDLSDRIDRAQEIKIAPHVFTAKWYNFLLDVIKGEWAEAYKEIYGLDYGVQRVDTGYNFDADAVNLLDGNAFHSAVSSQETDQYFCRVIYGNDTVPAALLYPGASYILWGDTDGKAKEFSATPVPEAAIAVWYNSVYPGFDLDGVSRLQFHTKDRKSVAGEDVLVRYEGNMNIFDFMISDDLPEVLALNGGRPCWCSYRGPAHYESVPTFSRFHIVSGSVTESLEFGTPKEVEIPGVTFADGSSMYSRFWKDYVSDLYDKDARVMKCRVHLDGLQAGPELLRRFYYYEGAIWALNKISNYSLTTYDATECEFIKVKDIENYR